MTEEAKVKMKMAACCVFDPDYYEKIVKRAKTYEQVAELLEIRLEYQKSIENVNKYYSNKIEEILG